MKEKVLFTYDSPCQFIFHFLESEILKPKARTESLAQRQ